MHDHTRTANLLGATALTVTDLMLAEATVAGGASASGAAALVVLRTAPGLSVTELGRRVGLSQSAAARMVDALGDRGLVRRESGAGRWVRVHLTPAGSRAARRLTDARAEPLRDLLGALDESELATLDDLLGTLLARLYQRVGSTELLCRLCDRASCTKDAVCPVGEAARRAGR